ncbi:hypothetical protein AJ80_01089 [Polytolypa hystricis UAMH7299]|uniref:F-box domain-containing protein n=1 Tax=Polytolypa hystricis (strain UAMH7299) TaxID=1447883 RepID=A0A2B7Z1L9_POLH7|nr:hypothetical protein AJ80_01089 [Polytolypa hystricis UAMH7299]
MSAETSQSSKRNLNQTKQAPIFLSLPLEIRLQIYDVLRNPRGNPHHVSLLYLTCVCRQLRDENFPSLLPKNKCFRDRIKFTEWASRIDPKWLSYTKELSLNLKSNLGEEFHASVGEIERAKKQSLREGLGPEAPGTGEWWEMKYLELLGKDIPTAEQAAAEEEEQEAGKELSTSTPGRRPCKPAEPPSSRPIPQLWDILCSLSRLRALKISLLHFVRDGPNGPNPPPLETMLDTMVPEHYLIAQMLPHAFPTPPAPITNRHLPH